MALVNVDKAHQTFAQPGALMRYGGSAKGIHFSLAPVSFTHFSASFATHSCDELTRQDWHRSGSAPLFVHAYCVGGLEWIPDFEKGIEVPEL